MKKYTLEDFKGFERNNEGFILCPSGDYSDIKKFPALCRFGSDCVFGEGCVFGSWCRFGNNCSFGNVCRFGYVCGFADSCSFGECCIFDNGCRVGECCSFGNGCSFGDGCSFGCACGFGKCCKFDKYSIFGDWCRFGKRCSVESNKQLKQYAKIEGAGSKRRCTYFFLLTDGRIYVRCGLFAGYEEEFIKKVKETHGGTIYEKQYFLALEFAKSTFEEE